MIKLAMKRRQHTASLKAQVAMEVIQGRRTLSEIASEYGIHPNLASKWKIEALDILKTGFNKKDQLSQLKEKERLIEELYRQLGKSQMELDWLKKKIGFDS